MLTLKIIGKNQEEKAIWRGSNIEAQILGGITSGDKIKVLLDGCDFIAFRPDSTMQESIIWVPGRSYEYVIPNESEIMSGYHPDAFKSNTHVINVREPDEEEIYGYRNIALNSSDLHGRSKAFPHASANFVTRGDPCFYERNAIDGVINNQGHGIYPYHSWAGGAREDLEYTLDFGRETEIDKLVFYLRADFRHDKTTDIPHDSYWKNIDIELSDGEIIHGEFVMDNSDLNFQNSRGIEICFDKKITKSIRLINFKQATEILSFAALTQIEVYGKIIKEDLSKMEVRQASNAKDVKHYTTERLREEFHIASLFTKDNIRMVYSHIDRIITAGLMPVYQTLTLEAGKEIAAEYFLERREMGCINVGGKGIINVDGTEYEMNPRDGIYIGKGNKDISFKSIDHESPAKFYVSSCPAHTSYPTVKIDITKAKKVPCGSVEECNKRVINQYIHPEVMSSCQLAMGLTQLEPGSNWNTMPSHTHDRRMEVYMYLDMGEDDVVFHMMGEPTETRHIIMHNEEAVISPSWSIHSGVGTRAYSFIWAMCGENQEFTDMDHIETKELR